MVKQLAALSVIGPIPVNRLKRQHFTSAGFFTGDMMRASATDPGEGSMFDQTLGGSLRNLAIGLVLTAAVVGMGFALAFY
jgi:hypothetical protein